jgi:EpsI family protein
MNKPLVVSIVMGVVMVLSGVLAWVMTPTIQANAQQDKINLEAMIPVQFDNWKIEPVTVAHIINPNDQGLVVKIYSQTVSRTYINNKGERVMLSIAYGGNQSTDMHVHRPEICYAAGGFEIGKMTKAFVDTTVGRIPVMHLVAKQGTRNEPITYWVRVGDSLTRGWIEQKVAAIGYGLTKTVPDGLLFRISTISGDEQDSYRIQQSFLDALLKAVRSEDRHWLIGRLAP